ncbi:MAG: hypothetical protein M1331_02040 [Candidatus Marsarchaeota archaeon]|nr:hypothetical protein [Candidatus Marsarchaeota archaeon]
MPPYGSLVDRFSGMVTRQSAERFSSEGRRFGVNSAQDVVDLIRMNSGGGGTPASIINVQDRVYRVFNQNGEKSARGMDTRDIVLGASPEGQTARALMYGSAAGLADSIPIERGDEISMASVLLDCKAGVMKSIARTSISIIKKSSEPLPRLDSLQGSERNIDIAGKVLEIGPLKPASGLLQSQRAESYCIITDFTKSINARVSGSAALALAGMKPGDFIKIEFCSTLLVYGDVVLAANNNSRVFSSPSIAERLQGPLH